MKKAFLLLLLFIAVKVSGQISPQTYWTPGVPTSSVSFTPTFRYFGTDSLANFYLSNASRWNQVYTAAQDNARFLKYASNTPIALANVFSSGSSQAGFLFNPTITATADNLTLSNFTIGGTQVTGGHTGLSQFSFRNTSTLASLFTGVVYMPTNILRSVQTGFITGSITPNYTDFTDTAGVSMARIWVNSRNFVIGSTSNPGMAPGSLFVNGVIQTPNLAIGTPISHVSLNGSNVFVRDTVSYTPLYNGSYSYSSIFSGNHTYAGNNIHNGTETFNATATFNSNVEMYMALNLRSGSSFSLVGNASISGSLSADNFQTNVASIGTGTGGAKIQFISAGITNPFNWTIGDNVADPNNPFYITYKLNNWLQIDTLGNIKLPGVTSGTVVAYYGYDSTGKMVTGSGGGGGGTTTNPLTLGYGILGTSFNGSAAVTAKADNSLLQTVLNFFPKADTRYYTKTAGDAKYALQATTISPGYAMLGGGSLAANRTVSLDTSIAVSKTFAGRYVLTNSAASLASLNITGTAGAGFQNWTAQSSTPSNPATGHLLAYADASSRFTLVGNNGFALTLSRSLLTASRLFNMPDSAGTFALESRIIPNVSLQNPAITLNGSSTALGGSFTVTKNNTDTTSTGFATNAKLSTYQTKAQNIAAYQPIGTYVTSVTASSHAISSGGTAPNITTDATATPTASVIPLWDANVNISANNHIQGYTTTATAAGTTTLTVGSTYLQLFTGSTTQTVKLPVTSTLVLGQQYLITNLSTGTVTVQSSGSNTIGNVLSTGMSMLVTCTLTSGTSAASWNGSMYGAASTTGSGSQVYSASPNFSGNIGGTINFTGNITFSGSQRLTNTQTTVSNSTSGSTIFSQPQQGASWKKVIIYCNAALGTASYTYPVAFTNTPAIVTTNGPASSVVTSISTTAVTITGASTSGYIILEGY